VDGVECTKIEKDDYKLF